MFGSYAMEKTYLYESTVSSQTIVHSWNGGECGIGCIRSRFVSLKQVNDETNHFNVLVSLACLWNNEANCCCVNAASFRVQAVKSIEKSKHSWCSLHLDDWQGNKHAIRAAVFIICAQGPWSSRHWISARAYVSWFVRYAVCILWTAL